MGFTEKRFNVERFNRLPEEALTTIVEASWKYWHKHDACDEKSPAEWREYLRNEDREAPLLHFGVSWNSQVVAMASAVPMDYPAVDDKTMTPWLANLFVLPEFRGKGLPEMLNAKLTSALKQLGYSVAYVRALNGIDVVYQRAGFEMVDDKEKIMKRNLRS